MAALDETFGAHGEILRLEGRGLSRDDLAAADVLLVRSVTRVGPDLLEGTPVRFVGSATIGIDHLDTDWLERAGIAWASAPGCNADAAAQYTLAMMMLACRRLQRDLFTRKVGIMGRGNVGSRLLALLEALGVEAVACDPPLEELGATGLASRSEVLDSDIVSLHVPLTRKGPHATWHMIGSAELAAMRESAVLVNSARGDVVDGTALRQWLESGGGHAALDCWPGEPDIDAGLLAAATVASPHVAGYSVEGKRRGTVMIYDAFCRRFGIRAWPVAELPEVDIGHLSPSGGSASLVTRAVLAVTGIERDDAALRGQAGRPGYFDALRRDYPPRREFQAARVDAPDAASEALLHRLGFRTKHTS